MSLKLLKAGMLTTVQDTGRYGHQKDGIIVSGAMDLMALRIGNLLAGNPESSAALEITLSGPQIQFTEDHVISLTGADLSATLDGAPLKMWRPVLATKGSMLSFGAPIMGCRCYLAISGGINVPAVLGSYATYLRAGFGGFKGRALQSGDVVPINSTAASHPAFKHRLSDITNQLESEQVPWSIAPQLYPSYTETPSIRAIKGPEYDLFSEESKLNLWSSQFLISPQSDRMGYRLQGIGLTLEEPVELLSSAVTFGTLQVPPEGNPILLMADHQTTGGYPRIAQISTADLPILAQLIPGSWLQFQEITLERAQQLYIHQEQLIEKIKQVLHFKMS
jgi:antagonist of KipI